jgi:pSer/pThr/pTyr-binding forkhead associated (FHA) protein
MPQEDPDRTITSDSNLGKRLSKVHKSGGMYIIFKGGKIPLTRRISIGRGSENSIVLDDVLASRRHAVIQKIKEEYFIEDLGSTNGTFLNGEPVPPGKYMRLKQEDTILIGRTELSLEKIK